MESESRAGKEPRQKKPKKPSRLTRQQKILIAVAAVLAVVLIVVVACQSLFVRPELPGKDTETEKEEIDYGEGVRPKSSGERKSEDYYTVLILGGIPAAAAIRTPCCWPATT